MAKRPLSPFESPSIKRQRRSRNVDLANVVDAEGDIFDDPCRSCLLKGISCLVSPRSTRCATCVRSGHRCSSSFSIQLCRSYGSLTAVEVRVDSAETDLGRSIVIMDEYLSKLRNTQTQVSNLQLELDILRRRRKQLQSSKSSTSPDRASFSPEFSVTSSVSSGSEADVPSSEDDHSNEPSASDTAVTRILSSPGEVAPSLEFAPALPWPGHGGCSCCFCSLGPSAQFSGEVPASLPSAPVTGVACLSEGIPGIPDSSSAQAPADSSEDSSVPDFFNAYVNPSFF